MLGALGLALMMHAQTSGLTEMERQKAAAEQEVREAKAELNANERQVNSGLANLRKIDHDIAVSRQEIETVRGQIDAINAKIAGLESSIATEEAELETLRQEYLKAVKKMRVARKQNSGLAFLFSSGNFNQARRRMRYMQEFSEWKDRRSSEIAGKVKLLREQRQQLAQAHSDASVALQRQQAAQNRLAEQRGQQELAVAELRANSDALRSKLQRRQAEARKLSSQISQLIAEQQAREAEARRKAEEERRAAEARAEAERRAAQERAAQEQARRQQQQAQQQTAAAEPEKSSAAAPTAPAQSAGGDEYASARKRNRTSTTNATSSSNNTSTTTTGEGSASMSSNTASGFEGMKGKLPRPVGGPFHIVSAFGVHPISPELPDIMDENLGIDAHVANGANAMAVYDGEVIKVYDRTNTPGFRNIVVVKHGDYITVYANLESLAVKSGQKVKQGQALGAVGADFDDPSQGMIHFEVWKNQTHLDPSAWISR